jgi:hypothetical protein
MGLVHDVAVLVLVQRCVHRGLLGGVVLAFLDLVRVGVRHDLVVLEVGDLVSQFVDGVALVLHAIGIGLGWCWQGSDVILRRDDRKLLGGGQSRKCAGSR